MRFHKLVIVFAIVSLSAQAHAASKKALRRAQTQEDTVESTGQGEQIVESEETTNTKKVKTVTAQVQPTLVVEAQPISDSKADSLRKARESEELNTEQRIVEKLEESRLREERERAQRLFGPRLEDKEKKDADNDQQKAAPQVIVVPATELSKDKAEKTDKAPTQVTIEKIEIIQPAAPQQQQQQAPVAPVVEQAPVPVVDQKSKQPDQAAEMMAAEPVKEDAEKSELDKIYVGAILAAPNYQVSNVRSNYGLGVSVSKYLDPHWVVEGNFLFSNHTINTFWNYGIYTNMDQYDLQIAPKYVFIFGKLRPYVGVSGTFIYRKYQDRVDNGYYWNMNSNNSSDSTTAFDIGVLGGVDFEVSRNFIIGAGIDYNHPIMDKTNFNSTYQLLPADTKPLEQFDYMTFKLTAKMSF